MKTLLISTIFCISCNTVAPLCEDYPLDHYYDFSGYEVNAVERDGLNVDAPEDYNTQNLANLIDAIDECLKDIGMLSFEEAEDAWCYHQEWFYSPIRTECIEFKVTNEWHWSYDNKYQMLWATADRIHCVHKGLSADKECYYRAGIQNGFQIVVPPKAQLLGEPLLRMATGCWAPYGTPKLARCAQISVDWDWQDFLFGAQLTKQEKYTLKLCILFSGTAVLVGIYCSFR